MAQRREGEEAMKVVYVTIEKQIRDVITAAETAGRKIDHIELTPREAAELAEALAPMFRYTIQDSLRPQTIKDGDHYYGVKLTVQK